MTTNQTLLQKADMVLADLANSGALLPEQSSTFIRKLIKSPTIIRQVRTVEMRADQRNINKIQFGKRILRAGNEGTALANVAVDGVFDPSDSGEGQARAKPTTEQITLNANEVIAEVRLTYDTIEENVERGNIGQMTDVGGTATGGGLVQTIIELIAERVALDLEELALLGDTSLGATVDDYLRLTDGYIREIEQNGNTADALGATIDKSLFKLGVKTMPDQYLRNRAALRHFISVDNETEYRDTVADRPGPLGDTTLQGTNAMFAFGSPIDSVSLMPEAKGIYTNPLNLLMGIRRQIMMEFDKEITSRVYIIVVTAKVDFQVEEAEAAVVYNNIG